MTQILGFVSVIPNVDWLKDVWLYQFPSTFLMDDWSILDHLLASDLSTVCHSHVQNMCLLLLQHRCSIHCSLIDCNCNCKHVSDFLFPDPLELMHVKMVAEKENNQNKRLPTADPPTTLVSHFLKHRLWWPAISLKIVLAFSPNFPCAKIYCHAWGGFVRQDRSYPPDTALSLGQQLKYLDV